MVFNTVHDMIILIVWEPEPRQFKAFAICWHPLLGAPKYWRAAFRSMTFLFSLRKLHSAPTHTLGLALHLSHSTHSTFPWFWVKRPAGFATPRFFRTGQSGPWKVLDISFILLNIQQELLCQTHTSPLILRFFNQSLKIFWLALWSASYHIIITNSLLLILPNSSRLLWTQNKKQTKNSKYLLMNDSSSGCIKPELWN